MTASGQLCLQCANNAHKFCGLHRRIIADVGPSHGRLNPRGKGTGRGKSGMFACHLPSVICLANCPDLRNRQR